MPPRVERSLARLAAQGFFVVMLGLAVIPAYLTLSTSWRPVAARLAGAGLAIAACHRVIRGVRRSIEEHRPAVPDVPRGASGAPELNEQFLRLRDEVVFSTRSRRYFDAVLWPQLQRLAGAPLPRPEERRRILRDGPSLTALARLVAEVEKGP